MNYLHRHIRITASTILSTPEIKLERKFDLGNEQMGIIALLIDELDKLKTDIVPAIGRLDIAERDSGDEAMVQFEINYFHLSEDAAMVSTDFGVCSTETIHRDERRASINKAINDALKAFTEAAVKFLGGAA